MTGTTTFPIATMTEEAGGRIGICPLPGHDGHLDNDMQKLAIWKPALVLSMTEQQEMDACGSGDLGMRLSRLGIDWVHLPVRDFGGLTAQNAHHWPSLSRRLHGLLDQGKAVLIHCRGGRGRSGMIALRLMVERGQDPDTALLRLRDARPGAVETDEQRLWAQRLDFHDQNG